MIHKPHDTSHTFATLMNNAYLLQHLLRSLYDIITLLLENIYTHKDLEELRKAIELI